MGGQLRRDRSRHRHLAAIVSVGAVIILAGCSSAVPHKTGASQESASPPGNASSQETASPQESGTPLTVGCSTAVAAARQLTVPRPVTAPVAGHPTALVGTADGRWAFASVTGGSVAARGEIAVLALGRGAPRLVRAVTLPPLLAGAYGMAMTGNGLLLVAGYTATAVLNVRALEDGGRDPVLGVLTDVGAGQFEVTVSGDDRYVFVSDETSGGLSVFNLATALQHGFSAPGVAVGIVPLARGAVGVAMAPDGAQLYVTTFGAYGPYGRLWIVDTARAEAGAGRAAVLNYVAAGCQPVRVAVSPDGRTIWVTALQSDALLGFSAADLRSDPSRALQAMVRVGSEPVGLLLVDDGRLALVGNSNRGLVPGTGTAVPQTVAIISTTAALAHQSALIGAVPTGLFPRDISLDPATGQVLLGNFDSDTVEAFTVPAAP